MYFIIIQIIKCYLKISYFLKFTLLFTINLYLTNIYKNHYSCLNFYLFSNLIYLHNLKIYHIIPLFKNSIYFYYNSS